MKAPLTQAERNARARARKTEAGGRRLPYIILSAEESAQLDALLASGYATSITGCVKRALAEASGRSK